MGKKINKIHLKFVKNLTHQYYHTRNVTGKSLKISVGIPGFCGTRYEQHRYTLNEETDYSSDVVRFAGSKVLKLDTRRTFYVHGSVHRESMSIIVQQDATTYSFIIYLQTALYVSDDTLIHHQEHTQTVITTSGTGRTLYVTVRSRGGVRGR